MTVQEAITVVDTDFTSRLSPIKLGGNPVKLYAPGATRPKGKTIYPNIGMSRHLPFDIDLKQARSGIEVFTPSEEQITVQLPDEIGIAGAGGESTGPATWDVQPYPTPISLYYQLDLMATTEAQALRLLGMVLGALPVPRSVNVGGRWARVLPEGKPMNLDALEKPLFRTAIRYEVSNVWVDRREKYTIPGIREVDMQFGAER